MQSSSFIPVPIYFDASHVQHYPTQFAYPPHVQPSYPYGMYAQSGFVNYGTPSAPPLDSNSIHPQTSISPPSYFVGHSSSSQSNPKTRDEIEMKPIGQSTDSSSTSSSSSIPVPSRKAKETTIFATSPIGNLTSTVSPSIEAFEIQQKKCKKCFKFYKEDQNNFDSCHFHSGHFQSVYKSTIGMGCFVAWTCCKSDKREAIGCKLGRHLECQATSAALKQFTQAMESQKQKEIEKMNLRRNQRNASSNSLIDLNSEQKDDFNPRLGESTTLRQTEGSLYPSLDIGDNRIVKNNNNEFIKHNVVLTDTLSGLSIRYNVSVEEIKNHNKLTKDEDIWTRFELLIPFRGQDLPGMDENDKKRYKMDMKARLTKRFRRASGTSEAEARYYLKLNKWDYDLAMKEFKDDVSWEKSNPPRVPLSKKM